MKRLTICVLAMMAICVQAFATDITGKWKTTLEDDGTEIPCVITVTKSDILFSVDMEEDDDEMGLISMSIMIPASYTIEGDKLNITLNKEGVEIKLGELKPKSEELKNLFENEETKGMVMSLLEGALDSYKDKMIGEDNFLGGELTIKEVTPTTLTLQDETGENVIFTRIQE